MPKPKRQPVVPTPPPPEPPAAVCKLTAPAGGGTAKLYHVIGGDAWRIAFEPPEVAPSGAAACLAENEFAAAAGGWERPVDAAARFTDLIDAERVLLQVAALAPQVTTRPTRKAGRGKR